MVRLCSDQQYHIGTSLVHITRGRDQMVVLTVIPVYQGRPVKANVQIMENGYNMIGQAYGSSVTFTVNPGVYEVQVSSPTYGLGGVVRYFSDNQVLYVPFTIAVLTVHVLDNDNKPVPNASVTMFNPILGLNYTCSTDEQGKCSNEVMIGHYWTVNIQSHKGNTSGTYYVDKNIKVFLWTGQIRLPENASFRVIVLGPQGNVINVPVSYTLVENGIDTNSYEGTDVFNYQYNINDTTCEVRWSFTPPSGMTGQTSGTASCGGEGSIIVSLISSLS